MHLCLRNTYLLLTLSLVFLLPLFPIDATAQTTFLDVTKQVGITEAYNRANSCGPALASGSAWADYDNDGDVDLYITDQGGPSYLYRNEGDTDMDGLPNFTEVADEAGISNPDGAAHSAMFIDYDNDGDQDFFLTRQGGNLLFENNLIQTGIADFVDVTAVSGLENYGRAMTSTWGDFNGDSYLDVYLAKHQDCPPDDRSLDFLYMNNGDGTFSDVSGILCPGGVSPCPELEGNGFMGGWVDYDNDADPDLYLVNDFISEHRWPNVLWRNDGPDGLGGWIFTDVSVASGADVAINGMGLGVGDYDNDGDFDFAISNIEPNVLLENQGDGTFTDVAEAAGITRSETPNGDRSVTWGTVFFDYNNDQWLDLYFVAGEVNSDAISQPNAFFHNNSDGTFDDISIESGLDDTLRGRCASIVDFDNDGYVDVFVGNIIRPDLGTTAPYLLFRNESADQGNTNHWLTVTVEGTVSNRDGIGTRFWLTTPDQTTQIREISSGPTYGGGDYRAAFFGLGSETTGELTVRWPTGVIEEIGTVSADQIIHLVEPDTSEVAYRINAGGPDFVDGAGNLFVADKEYTAGDFGHVSGTTKLYTNDISGTEDDTLYQSLRRRNSTFSYIFDNLDSGDYEVTLHFMEPVAQGVGNRLFDIAAEDSVIFDDYDIYSAAGDIFTAVAETVTIPVEDGQLNIDFIAGTNSSTVAAIAVVQKRAAPLPDPPVVSDIPDQTIMEGEAFSAIQLNSFVSDPDDHDSTIVWTFSGNTELRIRYDATKQRVRIRFPGGWTGSETLTFTATDPEGNSDSDDATFTVTAALSIGGHNALEGGFPNPFNPTTTIRYAVKDESKVSLRIYNMLGQEVVSLIDDIRPGGQHSVVWNGRNMQGRTVASGTYILRMVTQSITGSVQFVETKRLLLLK